MIADEEARPQVESAVDKQGRAAFKAAGNMVDWFSADFDRLPWSAEFDRRKQLVPSSSARRDPIWAYALKAEADS